MKKGIVVAVIGRLRAQGLAPVSYEYPSYIHVGKGELGMDFGTANGTWGWSDADGNSGESTIPADSEDVQAIVAYVFRAIEEPPQHDVATCPCAECEDKRLKESCKVAVETVTPKTKQVRCECIPLCKDISKCDAWECLCGNTCMHEGFYPCDTLGNTVEPTERDWPVPLWVCDNCGAIIDQRTGEKVGVRAATTLQKAYANLSAILDQWNASHLPDDFFRTPYEMNEVVHELAQALGNVDNAVSLVPRRSTMGGAE